LHYFVLTYIITTVKCSIKSQNYRKSKSKKWIKKRAPLAQVKNANWSFIDVCIIISISASDIWLGKVYPRLLKHSFLPLYKSVWFTSLLKNMINVSKGWVFSMKTMRIKEKRWLSIFNLSVNIILVHLTARYTANELSRVSK